MKPEISFNYTLLMLSLIIAAACSNQAAHKTIQQNESPEVLDNGNRIVFPNAQNVVFFETDKVDESDSDAKVQAPATVAAIVVKSEEGANGNIILFENPDLANNYTVLIQHLININQIQNVNIRQKKIELERFIDLQAHGAATGRDLLEAQTALSLEETNLANEKAALIEHEAKLKAGGFSPEMLRKAPLGIAYIICNIPENQTGKITEGGVCTLEFTAFPDETHIGKIDKIADMIDGTTRMIKLRISVDNTNNRFKAGMFAMATFNVDEGKYLSIPKNALITVQSKNYAFVKTGKNSFERKEINIGDEIGDRIIVDSGLHKDEEVAVKGVMQLKGLSFGY